MDIIKRTTIWQSGQPVDAKIIELTPQIARSAIDAVWWKQSGLPPKCVQEPDYHWNWEGIVLRNENNLLRECVAVLSPDKNIVGAMVLQYDGTSALSPGNGSVYISWLASAPKNRLWLCDPPAYTGVGTVLFDMAVSESYNAGLEGRVTLASVQDPKTLAFYAKRGFVRTGEVNPRTRLIDHELPAEIAMAWLKKGGN